MPHAADRLGGTLDRDFARARAAWARRRQGEDHLPVTIAARRVYILPTRAASRSPRCCS